jgi:hypothetical protein
MTASIHWRTRAILPKRSGSSLRSGRTRWAPGRSVRPTGEALVGQDHLPGPGQVMVAFQQCGHHLPFPELRVCQAPGDGHALGGGDQVEPESPEVAGVAAAVAVSGVPGEVGAFDGLAGGRAGQRGGVDQPEAVVPGRHLPGQGLDHVADQRSGSVEPLVVRGLLGQVAEEVTEPGVGEADSVPPEGPRFVVTHEPTGALRHGRGQHKHRTHSSRCRRQAWISGSMPRGPRECRNRPAQRQLVTTPLGHHLPAGHHGDTWRGPYPGEV